MTVVRAEHEGASEESAGKLGGEGAGEARGGGRVWGGPEVPKASPRDF
jgi:hypothetical protein